DRAGQDGRMAPTLPGFCRQVFRKSKLSARIFLRARRFRPSLAAFVHNNRGAMESVLESVMMSSGEWSVGRFELPFALEKAYGKDRAKRLWDSLSLRQALATVGHHNQDLDALVPWCSCNAKLTR